ncbi:MAG: pantoate--beta-alanine ligase [Chloroflexi bacterium]|nr:pantoate--beta-alanine ligase [Chloroflexota bacterium]MDE2701680.1 pantoate--beta-alanine ligase [Chloroflexota bacterium]MDE2862014.1 pantoate--beta-alanine ligase [Chloroflexota bacterium]MDE2935913.1 pantoate--beta-alanine ligase [Chloroflexota bacterium]MXW28015.1 pantoate--beta-alanine ligase [Chloroflexota bacterium]
MEKLDRVADLRAALARSQRPLGLVPTMGALHAGHLALVKRARGECACVVASIFVNPTQFGRGEDLADYPRPLSRDLALLEEERVDIVFAPSSAEMYPDGFASTISVGGPALPLEGAARPGHFDGVATIVAKLLGQSLPDRVYLGQKDGQQVAVIRRLLRDLDIPTEIAVEPTVRAGDGLALSSRNSYLAPVQRAAATVLYRALSSARDRFGGEKADPGDVEAFCRGIIESEPLIDRIDYVAAVDPDTIEPWTGHGPCMLAAAVRLGDVRLIDNVLFT